MNVHTIQEFRLMAFNALCSLHYTFEGEHESVVIAMKRDSKKYTTSPILLSPAMRILHVFHHAFFNLYARKN